MLGRESEKKKNFALDCRNALNDLHSHKSKSQNFNPMPKPAIQFPAKPAREFPEDPLDANGAVVYITQHPRPKGDGWVPDFSKAQPYGRLEYVFEVSDRAYADPAAALRKAMTRLKDFNPDKDCLLWCNFGDPATLFLIIMILVARGFKTLKFLYWSRGRIGDVMSNDCGYYAPIILDVSKLPAP